MPHRKASSAHLLNNGALLSSGNTATASCSEADVCLQPSQAQDHPLLSKVAADRNTHTHAHAQFVFVPFKTRREVQQQQLNLQLALY